MAALLAETGIDAPVLTREVLGIGTAGLNARGPRDEDGTHDRVVIDDGRSFIYREFATTSRASQVYQPKEIAVFEALRSAGLPTPDVLASSPGDGRARGEPATTLLSDGGGAPLETVFRNVPKKARPALWTAVGATLRHLHAVDVSAADFLNAPVYQRPWTRFLPYFLRSLKRVRTARPDLGTALDELLALRRPLQEYLDARPRAICFSGGGYLPGMLLERDGDGWRCTSWLSLGYYVSIDDPARDVVAIALSHREWTGDDVPPSFYKAYGSRPDPLCELLYETASQLGRGAAYLNPNSGANRKGWGPPPHSTAIAALDGLPRTVEALQALLRS